MTIDTTPPTPGIGTQEPGPPEDPRLAMLAEAFERSEFDVAISDAQSQTFLLVNPAFARNRGYTPEELVREPILSVIPRDRWADLKANTARADALGHYRFEFEHQRKDGTRFPVLIDLTVRKDAEGMPQMRIAYVQDISDRKRAEKALDRKSTRLNSSHNPASRMPSSA
jgi:PAS domain S-box-containing protein